MSLVFTLFGLFGTDMVGNVDNWWFFYFCVAYFLYRILDETDGKVARNSGNSSPLGMVLDHGCDAYACALLQMALLKAMQIGGGLECFFV
jgi:ethanolaminephosphotransferase